MNLGNCVFAGDMGVRKLSNMSTYQIVAHARLLHEASNTSLCETPKHAYAVLLLSVNCLRRCKMSEQRRGPSSLKRSTPSTCWLRISESYHYHSIRMILPPYTMAGPTVHCVKVTNCQCARSQRCTEAVLRQGKPTCAIHAPNLETNLRQRSRVRLSKARPSALAECLQIRTLCQNSRFNYSRVLEFIYCCVDCAT